jgi:nucleoside-diphosphate-sugar epimerase
VAYNVCSGAAVRIREIGELVARQMLVPQSLLRWGSLPYRPGESMRAVGENSRFVQATGWQPRVGLNDGIARSLTSLAQAESVRLAG